MNLVGSLSASAFRGSVDWAHAYIALAAFLVCAFVAFTVLLSFKKSKVDYNTGAFTYLKFIYATFLKPHDKGGDSQQDALESFYKTQVRFESDALMFPNSVNQYIGYGIRFNA